MQRENARRACWHVRAQKNDDANRNATHHKTNNVQAKSAAEIEREQEALLRAKYGGAGGAPLRRKQPLVPREPHKYFDSADWALAKEGANKAGSGDSGGGAGGNAGGAKGGTGGGGFGAPSVSEEEALPPRTSPVGAGSAAQQLLQHRASKLEAGAPHPSAFDPQLLHPHHPHHHHHHHPFGGHAAAAAAAGQLQPPAQQQQQQQYQQQQQQQQ